MQPLILPAPGKLNLFLHVLGRRLDGYHNLQTVFQLIDYYDRLKFLLSNDSGIEWIGHIPNCAEENNLIIKAANLLQKTTQCKKGAKIDIEKNLPIGAGLGGGSSDAATTLIGLNQLWQTNLGIDELVELGRHLGADVPVFIHGHSAWGEGIGDQLTPLILPEHWYLIVVPDCQITTAKLYQDPRLTRNHPPLTINAYSPGQGNNDFEPLVCEDYPQVAQALEWLRQYKSASLTGTGAAVFAVFDTIEEAGKIAALAPDAMRVIVTKGINHSPLQLALACA